MSQASAVATIPCSLSIAPSGHVVFCQGDAFGHALAARAADRIEAAFQRSWGHGLLHLGLEEVAGELGPTLGYWRELSRLYLSKLCAVLDLNLATASGLNLPLEPHEVERFLEAAPPMLGLEYLSGDVLVAAWSQLEQAFLDEVEESRKDAEAFLKAHHSLWSSVGRVFFHLAENKTRPDRPFAFLATYTARLSSQGKLQYVPLGQALKEQAAAANKQALLALLVPVQKAAAESPFLKVLVDSGQLFQPQLWSPREAYEFLRDVPRFEASGIFVRVPNWWQSRTPPRLQVGVTVGKAQPAGVGAEAILDFSVDVSLDGESISEAEWREILAGTGNLALVKGRWVEVDRDKLREVLKHWKDAEKAARSGMTFHEGEMEHLFGIEIGTDSAPAALPPSQEKPRSTSRRSRKRQTRTRAQPAPRGGYHAKVSLAEARRALLQQYFEEQDTLTATQYRALFSVPAAKASQELRRLTDARLLIQRGKKRGTKYIVGVELF